MNNKPIHSAKYSAFEVAAYIFSKINEDGIYITWLHMSRLLYFAQAYNFVLYGEPLFYNDIYVSNYAIHIEDLHEGNHIYSGMVIKTFPPLLKRQRELDEEDKRNINDLLETLRDYSNADLVKIIMKQEIWRKARSQGLNTLIPKEDFRECFYKKSEKEEEEKQQARPHSKSKRYRIKPYIVKNFFGVCTIISSIAFGFGIDSWIAWNVCSPLAGCSLVLKLITLVIIIHYVCEDDHEDLEEAIISVEEKLRSELFEEVD